ncbi:MULTISPECIES: hypothetical protein [unclassified Polaribacter]|uniref:hypothetical protein n=1 Tax=unclassified Polaribacter TaxID=196858 RepID=UPI0011BEE891|nr:MULTISPECIES: hypothetical protein [unclassified Polaribacter]TXD52422.1 hypothetical protein ES043_08490 [Polaribacter sp. IC063]TXD61059.1 hypothetical protein ES044_05760 [Polaribacter sp. IC066]
MHAQAKFKDKTLFGWFADRGADKVYLLNKKVILNTKTEKRGFDFAIDWGKVVEIFNKIYTFFLSKPESSTIYISNEYDFKTKLITNYIVDPDNLLSLASNIPNLIIPTNKVNKPLVDIDFNLENFFGKKIDKAITINVMSLEYKLSNDDIIKLSYEALSGKKIKLDEGETGAIVFIYTDPKTMEAKPVAYSLFGEKITVQNLAVASRDFDVPQNFKLDDLSFLYKYKLDHATGSSKEIFGLKFKFRIDIVSSVDVELESGAYYLGNWGGSKFKVKY